MTTGFSDEAVTKGPEKRPFPWSGGSERLFRVDSRDGRRGTEDMEAGVEKLFEDFSDKVKGDMESKKCFIYLFLP